VAGTALTAMVALRGRHGPPGPALALFRDAIEHWRGSRNRTLLVTTLRNLVVLLARTGHDRAAAELAATLEAATPTRSYGAEAARVKPPWPRCAGDWAPPPTTRPGQREPPAPWRRRPRTP
jgi:hypothetical protein